MGVRREFPACQRLKLGVRLGDFHPVVHVLVLVVLVEVLFVLFGILVVVLEVGVAVLQLDPDIG